MQFEILHTTDYRYSQPVIEAYLEARLTPPDTATQSVISRSMVIAPELATSQYVDVFGNAVDFFSMTLRHERLAVRNRAIVKTRAPELPEEALAMPVAEARQVISSVMIDYFDYLQPTATVPIGGVAADWARRHLRAGRPLREALGELNATIHRKFDYMPGSTDNSTPLRAVWKQKRGVCQDYAHVMLSVLRTAGLPARYVCGYIEAEPLALRPETAPRRRLVGSIATHAWVEVLVPGLTWVALDPTNDRWCAEQHVAVSFGRDSRDAAPVRGTFKGSGTQVMKVRVKMRRVGSKP